MRVFCSTRYSFFIRFGWLVFPMLRTIRAILAVMHVSFDRYLTACHILHFLLEQQLVQVHCLGHIMQIYRAMSIWVPPVCQIWLYHNRIFTFKLALTNNTLLDTYRARLYHNLIKLAFLINHKGMFDYDIVYFSLLFIINYFFSHITLSWNSIYIGFQHIFPMQLET